MFLRLGRGISSAALCHWPAGQAVTLSLGGPEPIFDRVPRRASAPSFMDLLEYHGKQLFAQHRIPVPRAEVAKTVDEAVVAAEKLGFPCAIKAQVLIGGRGKAGGI